MSSARRTSMNGSSKKSPPSPTLFIPQPRPLGDIERLENVRMLEEQLRQVTEQLSRCSPTMRASLEARRAKIQARLAHLSSMRNVETDLRDTHLDGSGVMPLDTISSTADNAVPSSSSPVDPSSSSSSSSTMPVIMSTKARIMASPIRATYPSANTTKSSQPAKRIQVMDFQTSIRRQQEEADREMARRRALKEAAEEKERKIHQQVEEAAAQAREIETQAGPSSSSRRPHEEDWERRARILAFMNYRPPSDEEDEDDDDDMDEDYDDFNDASVQAMYDEANNEAEFEYRLRSQGVVQTDTDREREFEGDVHMDGLGGHVMPLNPEALMDIIRVDPSRFHGP